MTTEERVTQLETRLASLEGNLKLWRAHQRLCNLERSAEAMDPDFRELDKASAE